jgi:hypothetical protein
VSQKMIAGFAWHPGRSGLAWTVWTTTFLTYSRNISFARYGDWAIGMRKSIPSRTSVSSIWDTDFLADTSKGQYASPEAEMQHGRVWYLIWRLTGSRIFESPRLVGNKTTFDLKSSQSERPVSSRLNMSSIGTSGADF